MIFPFLVSFLSFAHLNVGGELYISEILFAVFLFFSIGKFHYLRDDFPRKVLLLGGLWLASQILTDVIRDTPPENYLRGWAAIIFFLIDFCAVYIMVRTRLRVISILIAGAALGTIFAVIFLPTDYSVVEPWKFGYGPPITLLVLLYISSKDRYKTNSGLLLLVALGCLGIILNARSLGGMTILTAGLLYLSRQPKLSGYVKQKRSPAKIFGLFAGLFATLVLIMTVYQWSAEANLLPDKVVEKYKMAKGKDTGLIGMIAGGRPEILISSRAVADSPIIGHGSWAEDAYYTNMIYEAVAMLGLDLDTSYLEYIVNSTDLIPTHSVLMQAWVWAGLLGAIFWLFVLGTLIRNTFVALFEQCPYQPLVIYLGIHSCWNLLFSPFGSNVRITWALALCVIYFAVKQPPTALAGTRSILSGAQS